jgi:hypothetical protein
MSNIYLMSNELCDFCNVPHGSKMHMKQIVRIIEDYILRKSYEHPSNNSCGIMGDVGGQPIIKELRVNKYMAICHTRFNNPGDLFYTIAHKRMNPIWIDDNLRNILPKDNNICDYLATNVHPDFDKMSEKDQEATRKFYSRYTHNFYDIDVYLEMSGHLTPLWQIEIDNMKNIINEMSNRIDSVKPVISNNTENELDVFSKLLNQMEETYSSK